MKNTILTLMLAFSLQMSFSFAQYKSVQPNPYGERPIIVPVPTAVKGVSTPTELLNDGWTIKVNPEADFYKNDAKLNGWKSYTIEHWSWEHRDSESIVGLRKTFTVPAEYKGNRVILRFSATNHATTLYVNGKEIRSHWGAYGTWTADVTDAVTPGEEALIALRIDERNIGLAAFVRFTGSIYGDVSVYAVPDTYLQRMRLETDLDDQYKDATLELWLKTSDMALAGKGKVKVQLTSADGKVLKTTPSEFALPADMDEFKYDLAVKNPKKWDAEHPNLYTMKLSLVDAKGNSLETIERKIGFREVEVRENQVFVNGQEVKFRGIWGVDDAKSMRDINANHVRHKYMTEQILDSCDYYGVYVLHENGVDFAKFSVQSDPANAHEWMDLIADMMERDYNHPSVVMWGLGNESLHGPNILATKKYVKNDDLNRPTMYSWANRIKDDEEIPYDVYSYHYPAIADPNIDLSKPGVAIWHSDSKLLTRPNCPKMPILADEGYHVCISRDEAQRDPNVRNFWGESIKHFWDLSWNTKGSLGGDQFGMFTDMPNWNMPEPWLMRKAYSPAVIRERNYTAVAGKPLEIEIENRFCHTNLNECSIHWSIDGKSGVVKGPDVAPRGTGKFTIPFKNWKDNDKLELQISRADGFQVDEYSLDINPSQFKLPEVSSIKPTIEETPSEIIVKGKEFSITFNKYSAQITNGTYKGKTVLVGGPHLQFAGSALSVGEYWPDSISAKIEGNEAVVKIDGVYSPIKMGFEIRIDGEGLITAKYTIKHFPDLAPQKTTIPWAGADFGGYREIGVYFVMPDDVDRIEWNRRGLWSVYPEDHLGRETGIAYKTPVENTRQWKDIAGDFNWMGYPMAKSDVSNDFRASKEYIRTATALFKDSNIGIQALSEEKDAVRLEPDTWNHQILMYINNQWNYPTLGVGNWMKPAILIQDGYTNEVHLRLVDLSK